MKINNAGIRLCFGKISSKAIDEIRRHAEGYNIDIKENNASESYDLNPKYKLLNTRQLKTMQELASRASVLNKSIITGTDKGLCVLSHKIGHNCQLFDLSSEKEGDRDYSLSVLERAVEYAENLEKNGEIRALFNEKGYKNRGTVCQNSRKILDRFRSQKDNELMQSVYNGTITIKSEKPASKIRKSATI